MSSYYAVIPSEVRYSDLPDKAKLLYGEISALSNKYGYCTATNDYFAQLYGVHKNSISRLINQIEKENFIRVEMIYGKGKEIKERRMYLNQVLMADPINKIVDTPINKIVEENTTSNLFSNINNEVLISPKNVDNNGLMDEVQYVFGLSNNVKLLGKEVKMLVTKYGQDGFDKIVDKLSAYKSQKGAKYKSDYGAINNWVVKAVIKQTETKDSDYD